MEGACVSAVTTKKVEGRWFLFAISIILAFVMFGPYYGSQRKIEYEVTNKITLDSLAAMLSTTEIQRVPGLCFFYSSIQDGLTPILGHYIKNMRSLHKLTIFTTLRYLLVAKLPSDERIIIRRFGITGVYGCTIQYGYADSLNPGGDYFVTQVTNSLRHHIEMNSVGLSPSNVEEDISQLEEAISVGMVHVRGKTRFHLGYEVRSCSDSTSFFTITVDLHCLL